MSTPSLERLLNHYFATSSELDSEDWQLDPGFFKALSLWTSTYPDKSLDTAFEEICDAVDHDKGLLETVSQGGFPARGLVYALLYTSNPLLRSSRRIRANTKEIIHWVSQIQSTFDSQTDGKMEDAFTHNTWSDLKTIRDLIKYISHWATAYWHNSTLSIPIPDGELFTSMKGGVDIGLGHFPSLDITELDTARNSFWKTPIIGLLWSLDELIQTIRVLVTGPDPKGPEFGLPVKQLLHLGSQVQRLFVSRWFSLHGARDTLYTQQAKLPCDEDTRVELLSDIMSWVEDLQGKNILWLTGEPGVGKSAVATSVTQQCHAKGHLLVQIFIDRNYADTTNPDQYFPSIAYQLSTQSDAIVHQVYRSLKMKPEGMAHISLAQAMSLFVGTIQAAVGTMQASSIIDPLRPIVVVIDGLDETDASSLRRTAAVFSELFRAFPDFYNVKVLISSRPEDDIVIAFRPVFTYLKCIHLNPASQDSIDDVSTFLNRKLSQILHNYNLSAEWPGNKHASILANRASGQFLWAATAVEYLKKQIDIWGPEQLETILEQLSSDGLGNVDALYQHILWSSYERQGDKWTFEYFCRVVGAIVVQKERLHLEELGALLDPLGPPTKLIEFVKLLRSVLVFGTDRISGKTRPHLSKHFSDYITNSVRVSTHFYISTVFSHQVFASYCLYQLTKIESLLDTNSLANSFHYALRFWSEHLSQVSGTAAGTALVNTSMTPSQLQTLLKFSANDTHSGPIFLKHSPDDSSIQVSLDNQIGSWLQSRKSTAWVRQGIARPILSGHTHVVPAAIFSPDGSRVLSCSGDSTLRLWDPSSSKIVREASDDHSAIVLTVAFSPDGRYIASGSKDKTIRIRDALLNPSSVVTFEGHTGSVSSVAFSPAGDELVSGSVDTTIRRWNAHNGLMLAILNAHTGPVNMVRYSPGGTQIISCSDDYRLVLWDSRTNEILGVFEGHAKAVYAAIFSPNGQQIVSSSADNTIRCWDVSTGEQNRSPLTKLSSVARTIAFSPDGKKLVSGSDDATIRFWDVQKWQQIGPPVTGHVRLIRSVSFSPDGSQVVSSSEDYDVRLWNIPIRDIYGSTFSSFSSTGAQVLSGDLDDVIRIWDLRVKKPMGCVLDGRVKNIISATFSDSGLRVAAATTNAIYLWDTSDGKLVASISQLGVASINFQSNGSNLLVTYRDAEPLVLREIEGRLEVTSARPSKHSEVPNIVDLAASQGQYEPGKDLQLDTRWFPSLEQDVGLSAFVNGHIIRAGEGGTVTVVLVSPSVHVFASSKDRGFEILKHSTHAAFQIPDLALSHAHNKKHDIQLALRRLQWEGAYLIQVGFNEDMLGEGYIMEEIHVVLDSELSISDSLVISEFSALLSPFLGFIHTPATTCIIPSDSPNILPYNVGHPGDKNVLLSAAADGYDQGSIGPGIHHTEGGSGGGGNNGTSRSGGGGGSDRPRQNDSEGNRDRGGGGGSGGGGGDGGQGPDGEVEADQSGSRSISIPFQSSLYDKDQGGRTVFTISSKVDIKVEENRQQATPPPNSNWPGPWVGVDMSGLEGTASGVYLNGSTYSLGLSQIQIVGTSSDALAVVHYSPLITHRGEDVVKYREDKTVSGSIQTALSLSNPGIQVTGTSGHISSAEQLQGRWGIMTHPIYETLARREVGRLWKYAHNDTNFQRVTGHSFATRPSIVLGVGHATATKPKVDVEIVMQWSLSPMKLNLRQLLTSFLKGVKDNRSMLPPAFVNFFHGASISIDLQQFNQRDGWVTEAVTRDEQTLHPTSPGEAFAYPVHYEPTTIKVMANHGQSRCEVLLKRAIYGRVSQPSKEERTGPRVLLSPTSSNTESLSPPAPLPTPSPSPPSRRSILREEADSRYIWPPTRRSVRERARPKDKL